VRLSVPRSGLLAAAAVAGAIVYWRANERRRFQRQADEIDDAITEGRQAAEAMLSTSEADSQPFDQR
jgi:Flp pilus assembly protein TadB